MITPLLAREPYIAVAEASFGLIDARGLELSSSVAESMTTPSMTKIGWLVALSELIPRIRIEVEAPGVPELA